MGLKFIFRFIFFYLFAVLLLGCSHHLQLTPDLQKQNAQDLCFRLLTQNKFVEFKNNIKLCKDARNKMGVTTLMMAIAIQNNDFAEYLMDQNVDVNTTDSVGTTALVFAANKNNVRLVQLLRRHGARIEIVKDNLTGLMLAARNSSLDLLQVMNPTPAEINIQAEDGWTAIYFAVSRGDPDILQFFVDRGACTRTKDQSGQSAFEFAQELKWKKGIQILKHKTKC